MLQAFCLRPVATTSMSLLDSYRNLSPRTRLLIGGGIMTYAVAGMFLTDKAEDLFGFKASEKEKQQLKDAVPKIHAVDRPR